MWRKVATAFFAAYSMTAGTPRILLQAPPININPPPQVTVPAVSNTLPEACTMDIKQCPDGSYVSREPQYGCAFAPCPAITPKTTSVIASPTDPQTVPIVTTSTPQSVTERPAANTPATDPPATTNPAVSLPQTTLPQTTAPKVTAPKVTPSPVPPAVVTPVPTTPAPTPWVLPPGRVIPPLPTPSPSVAPPGGMPLTPSNPSAPTAPVTPPGISIIPPLPTPSPSVSRTPSGIPSVPSLPVLTRQPTMSNVPMPSLPIPTPPISPPIFVPINPVPIPAPVPLPPLPSGPIVTSPPINPSPARPAFESGFFGQSCPVDQYQSFTKCPNTMTSVSDRESGRLYCTQYDAECCLCSAVSCGLGMFGTPCTEFMVGNKGVYGVGDIKVAGSLSDGVMISCFGTESCALTNMMATNVRSIDCKGDRACEGATVKITDPFTEFKLYCSGKSSCNGLSIHIDFTGPPPGYMCAPGLNEQLQLGQIECLNEASCQNMHFTMDNTGCYQVMLRKLSCVHPTACIQSAFHLIGDIQLQECELGTSGLTATGLEKCYQNLREYQCSKPSACMGMSKTIVNPANGFEFKCGDTSSCEAAHFHFELNAEAQNVNQLSGFVLGGRHAARGATFTFDNQQREILDIDKIDCSGEGSCSGTRFITGPNVQIGEISCSSNSCVNCLVQFDATDAGIPCDPQQVYNGGGGVWQQQPPWNQAPGPAPAAQQPGPWIAV